MMPWYSTVSVVRLFTLGAANLLTGFSSSEFVRATVTMFTWFHITEFATSGVVPCSPRLVVKVEFITSAFSDEKKHNEIMERRRACKGALILKRHHNCRTPELLNTGWTAI
jgi:hypothetical protein